MNTGIYGLPEYAKFAQPMLGVGQPKPPLFPPPQQGFQPPQFGASGLGPMAPPAPQAAPPMPDPNGGILGAIDRIFGGPEMQNLSPAMRKKVRSQGLLTMGAQLLTATDPHGNRAQGLAPLGQAIFAGQQAYGQGIEQAQGQMADERLAQSYGQLLPAANESPQDMLTRYQKMLNIALQSGRKDQVAALSTAIPSIVSLIGKQGGGGEAPDIRIGPDGVEYQYMPPDAQHPGWWQKPTGRVKPKGEDNPISPVQALLEEQRRFSREAKLENDYTDETQKPRVVYQMLDNALQNTQAAKDGNPAAQVNLMYAFVKAMDEDSAVREGELKLLSGSLSVRQQIEALEKKYGSLEAAAIPPSMVDQVSKILEQGAVRYERRLQGAYKRYADRANRWKVDVQTFDTPPSKYYIDPADVAKKYGGQ